MPSFGPVDSPSGYAPPSCINCGCARSDGLLPRLPERLPRQELSEVHREGNLIGFFCTYSLSSGFCSTTADVYHAADVLVATISPFMTSISWMLGWCRYILGLINVFNLSSVSLWLLQCCYLIVEGGGGAFCCSMWLRKNMFRAVAGSESFRLHCRPPHEQKTMWRQPEGRGPTASSRNARASACASLLCLARSCGLANETPAMCRAVCAET